jgi:hypothetical protein
MSEVVHHRLCIILYLLCFCFLSIYSQFYSAISDHQHCFLLYNNLSNNNSCIYQENYATKNEDKYDIKIPLMPLKYKNNRYIFLYVYVTVGSIT